MPFCNECGEKLKEKQQICLKCGYNNRNANKPKSKNELILREAMTPKKTAALTIVLVFVFLVGVGIYYAQRESNPLKTVAAFKKAVNEKDNSKIKDLIEEDSSVKVNDKSIDKVVKYFENNPDYRSKVLNELDQEAAKLYEAKVDSINSTNTFRVKRVGNKFLVFPKYKIVVNRVYIEVKTKVKGADIYINDEKVGTSTSKNFSKEYGPYIADDYKVEMVYSDKFEKLSESQNIDMLKSLKNRATVELMTKVRYVSIKSDEKDAELFIDNKDTGKKVKDVNYKIPIKSSTKIYGVIQQDGNKLQASADNNSKDNEINLNFSYAKAKIQDKENEIRNLVQTYVAAFCYAVNNNNISYVQQYIYPNSPLYKVEINSIPNMYRQRLKESNAGLNITSIKIDDNTNSGSVTTHEVYNVNDNGNNIQKTFDYKYSFKYNDQIHKYQLTSIENSK
ncbi:zinc ribbon domain-containing protein [Clostridium felsineum]|uniref:Membrane-associated protein TcaA n=1 Tax=Clostridium felsineum TaxID=36839 RepID=A0A1S8LQB8_9CLOT|nr:hypothetical protein [Clostridium felsineum]URZ08321.1 hypothetical protein CLROS_037030 [Clostridium felsineum]URZ13352.1 hypothetical protein CROST_041180 [Clostridium felsineum]